MQQVKLNQQDITPSKIICVGRNYVEHIRELGNEMPEQMLLFCKPNSAISDILLAEQDEPLHYETELCFLIKNGHYAAVGVGLDLTKRQLQATLKQAGHPWERSKAFNGSVLFTQFVPLPACLETLTFTLHIDDELIQQGNIELMLHKPAEILSEIKAFMHLDDGDIVMTGTPKGVGKVKAGATFCVTLQHADKPLLQHQWRAQ